jgi:hypothetical protein
MMILFLEDQLSSSQQGRYKSNPFYSIAFTIMANQVLPTAIPL